MTNKKIDARQEVTVHGITELQLGDRIAFKATLGEDTRMNTSFTYGGQMGNLLVDAAGRGIVSVDVFLKNIRGYDNTEWHVWRKIVKMPTEVGRIIYVESTKVDGAPIGRYRRNRQGGFTSLDSREISLWCNQIDKWYNVTIDIIEPN